jgi:DNA modification methylase
MEKSELRGVVDLVLSAPPKDDDYATLIGDYIDWTIRVFNGYDKILKPDGCILYVLTYSANNPQLLWTLISKIIENTNFTTVDCITWKKSHSLPGKHMKNRLSRMTEFVFVFCRKNETKTFHINNKIIIDEDGNERVVYENIYNFIEAENNDGLNKLNPYAFSTELVVKLLNMYGKKGGLVYDSFMGIGTTANGAKKFGMNYIGSEIKISQVEYANTRLHEVIITDNKLPNVIEISEDDDFWK